jgi:NAD(P)-dependent dehydrogenase (short-subunit alcohol dehydrogenase family)
LSKVGVAVVTGGGSGIGRATALLFAREGYRVVVADRSEDKGIETARLIEASGGTPLFVRCDVSREFEVEQLVDRTLRAFGRIDCAFNNAGVEGRSSGIVHSNEMDWEEVIGTNLKGVWHCLKYEIPVMARQGKGAIVNASSVAGLQGVGDSALYSASKHGVIGLTESAALECARTGVRVNAVCPGVIETPMIERVVRGSELSRRELLSKEPLGRFGTAGEVADAVFWLCSDRAAFVTGIALPVDGGYLLR